MIAPTKEMVLLLHQFVAQESGGDPGVRDEALLDSALASAFQTFDGAAPTPPATRSSSVKRALCASRRPTAGTAPSAAR